MQSLDEEMRMRRLRRSFDVIKRWFISPSTSITTEILREEPLVALNPGERDLYTAIVHRRFDEAERLVDNDIGLEYIAGQGRTVLHIAMIMDAPGSLIRKMVLKSALDVDRRDDMFRRSALHVAVMHGVRGDVLLALLETPGRRVNPDIQDKFSKTPLDYVKTSQMDLDSFRILTRNSSQTTLTNGMHKLLYDQNPPVEYVALMIRYGAPCSDDAFALLFTSRLNDLPNLDRTVFLFRRVRLVFPLCFHMNRMRALKKQALPAVALFSLLEMVFGKVAPQEPKLWHRIDQALMQAAGNDDNVPIEVGQPLM